MQLFCNTRIINSDTALLTNFKLHQNESKTRHLSLYFLDIRTQEVQDFILIINVKPWKTSKYISDSDEQKCYFYTHVGTGLMYSPPPSRILFPTLMKMYSNFLYYIYAGTYVCTSSKCKYDTFWK